MAVLVALIPLLGLLVAVLLRERPARVRWAGSVAIAAVHLAVLVALFPQLPLETQLTTWSPTELFHGRVLLILDQASWILVLAAVSVFGSHLLRSAERGKLPGDLDLALAFGFLALAVAAFLAGNLLTVALTWAGVDVLAYVHLLSRADDERAVRESTRSFVLRGASTLVIVAGAIPEAAGGGGPVTQTLEISVLAAAVWLRCGLWPLPRFHDEPGRADTLLADLNRHMPAAMALGALSHVLGGVPGSGLAWVLVLVGGVNALYGGLQALRSRIEREDASQSGWTVAVGGTALLLMLGPRGVEGAEFAWWGAALIVGGVFHVWNGRSATSGAWPSRIVGVLVVVGPGLVHGLAGGDVAAAALTPLHWISAFLTVVVGSLLGLVFFVEPSRSMIEDAVDEPFVEGTARAASLLPLLVLALALADAATVEVGPMLGLAVSGAIFVAAGVIGLRKGGAARLKPYLSRFVGAFVWVSVRTQSAAGNAGGSGIRALSSLGAVLEGRAALLWMLVVVLALALGMVST